MYKKKTAFHLVFFIVMGFTYLLFGYITVTILIYILRRMGVSGESLIFLPNIIPVPLYVYVIIRIERFRKALEAKWFKES
jgi:hypothetical protein